MTTRITIRRFLDAVEARDVAAAAACFALDAEYQNVPWPPVHGPQGVTAMLTDIVDASTEIQWEIVTEAYGVGRGHLERIDRFVIDGVEFAIRCHGVFEVDETRGLITAFRDYVDLGPWRAEIAPAIDRWRARRDSHDDQRGSNTMG